MVILHCKGTNAHDQFLFECSTKDEVDNVTLDVATVWNLRKTLARLASGMVELSQYGPAREPEQRGLEYPAESKPACPDPNAQRVGIPPDSDSQVACLVKTAAEAEAAISDKNVAQKRSLSVEQLREVLRTCGGAVTIAYPQQLPEHDPIRMILDDTEDVSQSNVSKEYHDVKTCELWFASKKLDRKDKMSARFGNNDKTKVVVKIQKRGKGAPVREPAVDEETRKAMMSYWHKKQEVQKKLEQDDEDSYMNSEWANPNSLKSSLQGTSGIQFRPGM